jgi:phosphoribosylformimino-5-aminoimidazole carboxamide ribonucleotide (ProFAR) isomerase
LTVRNLRLIARLDIKGSNLIKGVQLEGVRVVGDPREFARRYYADGTDEILYMDAVASLYGRDIMHDIVRRTAEEVFVPITVGGGLRSVADVRAMLRAGADKIAINTAARWPKSSGRNAWCYKSTPSAAPTAAGRLCATAGVNAPGSTRSIGQDKARNSAPGKSY